MAQPMLAEAPVSQIAPEDFGVLVGWVHHDCAQGISLGMQSAHSQAAWARGAIDKRTFMMTRNQALLLAKYLLDVTGQTIDAPARGHGWRKVWAKVAHKT
jgi:hypothetical protein